HRPHPFGRAFSRFGRATNDRTGTGDDDGGPKHPRDENESNTNDPPGTESTREQENDPDSSHDRESSVEYKEGPPQGIPQDKFEEGAELIRQRVSHISDDIAAHGSRARGTARP